MLARRNGVARLVRQLQLQQQRCTAASPVPTGPSEPPGVTVVHPFMKHTPRGGGPREAGAAGLPARTARLAEACRLVESLDWRVAASASVGLERRSAATYVGKGKVREVRVCVGGGGAATAMCVCVSV